MTREEINILLGCQAKVFRTSAASALIGSAAVWAATRRLSTLFRVNLVAGAAAYIALWRSAKSLISCTDHILGLDGTRMQRELANIMIRTNKGESWRWKLLSKHFFSEIVYEDSNPDDPVIRWRARSFFTDSGFHEKRTDNADDSHGSSQNTMQNDPNGKKYSMEPKQVPVNSTAGLMVDPFDCVFGYTTTEEIHHPGASGTAGKVLSRNHKRAHRRRRMRHQKASLDTQHT
ncbi:uncharacterized protein LOC110814087 isoform X2 [Carica papaya]|nr:uncharacterized protein LOC110814087 isoform X2 [Carica papaya]